MVITENHSIVDSLMFLMSARETLSNIVTASSVQEKKELKDFIKNEASDYQIMSLLVTGDLPDEKFNITNEQALFMIFKNQIMENWDIVSEVLGGSSETKTFLNEIDSVYPHYSSAKPIMEHLAASGAFLGGALVTEVGEVMAGTGDVAGLLGKAVAAIKNGKDAAALMMKAGLTKAQAAAMAAQAKLVAAGSIAKGAAAAKLAAMSAFGGKALAGAGALGAAGAKYGKSIAAGVKSGYGGGAAVQAGTGHVSGGIGGALKGGLAAAKTGAPNAAAAMKTFALGAGGHALAGAALAALAAYASYKTYKRFFSQAAKACKGKGGAEKTACMKQFRVKGLQAQIADLQKAMAGCAKAKKGPEKCKAGILTKIASLKKKMAKAGA